ncbi:riboflavin biosynthesis protein RibD [Desulfomonile tiedjei DSM 6799]|uniref:Riboflavin biosynthesis protein RibD n=2 Tax=Desulfomonile tiedjei TaxID=2358 RepID=I4C2S8_DESTA|nr:riboflavin biosynthesis protein RibD [Desulfomonile tiedjei DSM 6799]
MAMALKLARRGLGRTSPNPAVGAVIVKNGKVVGKGYHRAAGEPHAEVEAIRAAGSEARGADLYVTLEPCNHHGRTPPCCEAILEAGIATVWYGIDDPNPGVRGGGALRLREAGLQVVGNVFEDACRRVNEAYLVNITQHRPFVYLKLAMSLDGRIATRSGHSQWITSEASRRKVHRLRDRVSAIMVGVETVISDNPLLTTRLPDGRGRDPIRIVADSQLRTPADSAIFNPSSTAGVIIASSKNPPLDRKYKLESRGAKVLRTCGTERVDLKDMLRRLYLVGITSLLIEGGAGLAWGALEAGVVDRCLFFYAPIIIGGKTAPSGVEGMGINRLEEAPRLIDVKAYRIGPDILLDGRVSYPTMGIRLTQK